MAWSDPYEPVYNTSSINDLISWTDFSESWYSFNSHKSEMYWLRSMSTSALSAQSIVGSTDFDDVKWDG